MTRPSSTRVTLRGVTKSFQRDEATVLINDLTIEPGEFLTLVGPSGCGKTTTMRMIAGLEEPTSGEILFGDRIINQVPVQRRNVAMVFQNYALYPHLRVADNLQYGLRKRRVPAGLRAEKVAWVAELLRIEALLDRKPREISGGEQQRVALGRAIIRNPDVLLLDEPLSNLDAKLRMLMRGELVRLQREIGCTTIFVTHDQLEAMTMSDRIVVLNKGRIQQVGTPQEIYSEPASLFVATFMGSPPMNLVEGEIDRTGSGTIFRGPGTELGVRGLPPNAGEADRQVTLGIRPEHVTLGRTGDVESVVQLVEFVGAEKLVFLDAACGTIIVRTNADYPVRIGDRLLCGFDRSKINFFSTASGERRQVEAVQPELERA